MSAVFVMDSSKTKVNGGKNLLYLRTVSSPERYKITVLLAASASADKIPTLKTFREKHLESKILVFLAEHTLRWEQPFFDIVFENVLDKTTLISHYSCQYPIDKKSILNRCNFKTTASYKARAPTSLNKELVIW